jgi:hypothetical protein
VFVVRNGLRKHPFVINNFVCKSLSFAESLCAISSIYLLIAMTIDKLICVIIPLKVGQLLTPTKARIIVTCILVISAMISSYTLFDKRVFYFESEVNIDATSSSTTATTPTTTTFTSTVADFTSSFIASTLFPTDLNRTNASSASSGQNKRISYDCDSNWPSWKNDWILVNNVIRVFIPFILLCICNSWIALALAKATRNTEALFRDSYHIAGNESAIGRSASSTAAPPQNFKHVIKFKKMKSRGNSSEAGNNQNVTGPSRSDSMDAGYLTDPDQYDLGKVNNGAQLQRKSRLKSSIHMVGNRHIMSRVSTNQHISIMLLAVSIGFILFNLPFAIRTLFHRQFSEKFKILDYLYHDDNLFITKTSKTEIQNAVKYEFFSSLTHLLLDLNYIANFFLYFFSGSRFRSQLYTMFRCRKTAQANINFTNAHFINNRNSVRRGISSNVLSTASADGNSATFTSKVSVQQQNSSRLKSPRGATKKPSKTLAYLKQKLFGQASPEASSNLNRQEANKNNHLMVYPNLMNSNATKRGSYTDSMFLNTHYKKNNARFVSNNNNNTNNTNKNVNSLSNTSVGDNSEISPFINNTASNDMNNSQSIGQDANEGSVNIKSNSFMKNSEF